MPDTLPTATPATASTGAAPSSPSPSAGASPKSSGGSFDLEFSELDRLAAEPKEKEKKETPPVTPKEEPPKTDGDKQKETPPADDADKTKPIGKAAELRTAYEGAKKRIADLEKEVTEFKSGKSKPADGEEVARYKETLAQREKRLADLETEIKYVNYEKSSEYQEAYEKPLEKAFSAAWSDLSELVVTESNGDTRKATQDDFSSLLRMPIQEAIAKAKEMFGDAATEVLAHRRAIVNLNRARHDAIEKYKKEGGEREKQTSEKHRQQLENLNRIWDETNKEIAEKHPEWFAADEKDPEGSKSLAAGFEMADAAFYGIGKLPVEQLAKIQATVRNRAAAFGRAAIKLGAANARIAALEKELEAFKKSAPGGEGSNSAPKTGEISANDELDQIAGLKK